MKATDLLKSQHREVKALFRRAKKAEGEECREVLDEITEKLRHHMYIEENVFYPAVQDLGTKKTAEMVPEAYEEHHVVQLVLNELPDVDPEDERFQAKMTVLDELIQHHVDEEEKEMFEAAQKLGDDRLNELGAEMEAIPVGAAGGEEEEEDEEYDDEDEDDAEDEDDELEAGAETEAEYAEDEEDGELDDEDETEDEEVAQPARGRRGGGGRRRSA
jgi:hypothetical protein